MANMIPISTVTVGSGGAANIEFTGIPQTYTDLQLKVTSRTTASTVQDLRINFNGVTTNLTERYLLGNGASVSAGTQSLAQVGVTTSDTNTINTFNNTDIYIPNYTSSNYKSVSADDVSENNGTTAYAMLTGSLWSNTSPINQITLTLSSGNFKQYSSATLYGIRKY